MTDTQASDKELPEHELEPIGVCFSALMPQDSDVPSLQDVLENAFVSGGIDTVISPDATDDRLVVLPVQVPVQDLARMLQAGIAPEAALSGWMDRTQEILALCRSHRRRLLVLAAGPLAAGSDESLNILAGRLDLDRTDRAEQTSGAVVSPLNLLLAEALLVSDPDAQAQADEVLAVMAGPVGESTAGLELISQAWNDVALQQDKLLESQSNLQAEASQRHRDLKMAETSLARVREKESNAVEQAELLRETMAETVQAASQIEERLELREAELSELRQAAQEQIAMLAQAEKAQNARDNELHQTQDRLRKAQGQVAARDKAITGLKADVAKLTSATADLRKAQSQVAARDKAITGLKADVAKLTSAKAEAKTSLKETRGAVQKLMEERDLLTDSLQETLAELKDARGAVQKLMEERDLLTDSLQEMLAEAAQLERKNELLQSHLGDQRLLKALKISLERQIVSNKHEGRLRESVLGQVILDAEARLRDVIAQHEAQSVHLAAQEKALRSTETRLGKREKALKTAVKTLSDEKSAAAALAETLAARDLELADQAVRIEGMSAELTKIYGSKSWKVTEPMRKARSQLPKKKP